MSQGYKLNKKLKKIRKETRKIADFYKDENGQLQAQVNWEKNPVLKRRIERRRLDYPSAFLTTQECA